MTTYLMPAGRYVKCPTSWCGTPVPLAGLEEYISRDVIRKISSGELRNDQEIDSYVRARAAGAVGRARGLSGIVTTDQDFKRLSDAQNHAIAIQAQISGIGQEAWDSVIDAYAAALESSGWIPASNYTYDKMMAFWLAQTKRLLVYGSAWLETRPMNEDVQDVERLAKGSDQLISLVNGYVPSQVSAQGASDRAQTEAALKASTLKSPDAAGQAAFKEELANRVNALASSSSSILWAAAILALALAFGRGRS